MKIRTISDEIFASWCCENQDNLCLMKISRYTRYLPWLRSHSLSLSVIWLLILAWWWYASISFDRFISSLLLLHILQIRTISWSKEAWASPTCSTFNCNWTFQQRFVISASNSNRHFQCLTTISTFNRDSVFQCSTAIATFNRDLNFHPRFQLSTTIWLFNTQLWFQLGFAFQCLTVAVNVVYY